MKKLTLSASALAMLLFASSSYAWFGGNNNNNNNWMPWGGNNNNSNWMPWGGGNNGWNNNYNPYDEWDPRYWMEEMENAFDGDDYGPGYGYGPGPGYGYAPGPGFGGPNFGYGGNNGPSFGYGGPRPNYGPGPYGAPQQQAPQQAPAPR